MPLSTHTKQVMMPNMVSISSMSDGVVLSIYLAPVSISGDARADVPGDFAVCTSMGSLSRGSFNFARVPVVSIANVLKLRCGAGDFL